MTGLVGDDSVMHASVWMLLMLFVGVSLLMLALALITRCAKVCGRFARQRVSARTIAEQDSEELSLLSHR